ncbi:competence protein CoiA family protein [Sporolactobacillus shoreicorticis]|uniref:Competence protein CoiA n=1 Tax=Sporolactobacillus shoreicorticis TaxID=1923877 RepID=A0ABW5S5H5_9BACL|nr:competence protein CoiA family protein [Sporolactobacillus shoreicorticis]MCO7126660.1 competence protein CoiA family protein [Sporolactobacillus shoreicorticis]
MLIASTKDAEQISLITRIWSREKLVRMGKTDGFYCPVCRAPVRLKMGTKRCWHFAHQPHHACFADGEPETFAHVSGKEDLFHWCKDTGRSPQLEHYLPALRQRPDLYLPGFEPTVIEYQCSVIPEHSFILRSKGYLDAHMTPVWVIGTDHYHRQRGKIRLSGFTTMAIRQSRTFPETHSFSSPYFVCFYDPSARLIRCVHILSPLSKTHFISQENSNTLSDFRPYQLISPPQKFLPAPFKRYWLEAKRRKRQAVPHRMTHEEYVLRTQTYQLRHYFACYPSFVGLPHCSFIHLMNPPLLWQMWVYLFMGVLEPEHYVMPRQIIEEAALRGMGALYELRCLPLCPLKTADQLVSIYLEQLVRLRVAEKMDDRYRLIGLPPKDLLLSRLLEEDQRVLERLEKSLLLNPINE